MKKISKRIIYEFVLVATALCGIGYLIHGGISSKLNEALEANVLRHIGTVSYSIENTLNREIKDMHNGIAWFERGEVTLEDFNKISNLLGKSTHASGILRKNGNTLVAHLEPFPVDKIDLIANVFYGQDAVVYDGQVGLIFATPIQMNGENCVFYQIYSNENLPELFGVISYDGMGRINLANRNGDWIELTKTQNDSLYNELFTARGFTKFFADEVGSKLEKETRAVAYYRECGEDFVGFGAKIYGGQLALFGIVTRDAVSAGAEYIHMAMLGGMVAMLVILIMYARASLKSEENKELKLTTESALQANEPRNTHAN